MSSGGHESVEKTLTETTVGIFGDVRVGVGNILRDDYELPDGSRRHGMTAQLFVARREADDRGGDGVTVGKGSRITLGAETWEVTRVAGSLFGRGSVTMRRISS